MTALTPRAFTVAGADGTAITEVVVSSDGEAVGLCFGPMLAVAAWQTGAEWFRADVGAHVGAIAFAPDGGRIVGACADGRIHVFDPRMRKEVSVLEGVHGGYYEIAWSPTGRMMAAGHYEPVVTVFDMDASQALATLDPDTFSDEGRTAVAFSPDGSTLLSTAYNAIVRWSLPDPFPPGGKGTKRRKLTASGHAFFIDAAFAPDGTALAGLAETEGAISMHVWEASGRKRGRTALPGFPQRLAWAADGAFIAVVERDAPGVSLWNPAALDRSDVAIEGVEMDLYSIAAHPSRIALIAGSDAGQLVIWERRA